MAKREAASKKRKVIDVREACCQDTLSTPIKNATAALAADEVLEVMITPSLKSLFSTLAEHEGFAILEEIEREDGIHISIGITDNAEKERKQAR